MSFIKELCDLANTAPELGDPEDDAHEDTKAKVLEDFTEGYEDVGVGKIRSRQPLPISDPKYVGKKTSRKELQKLQFSSSESESSDEVSELEDEESPTSPVDANRSVEEGLEDEDVEDETDEYDEEDSDDNAAELAEEESDVESIEQDETLEKHRDLEDDMVQKFSAVDVTGEIEKGKAVQSQLQLWDNLLELRIQLQKLLVMANRFPRSDRYTEFKQGLLSQDQNQGQTIAAVPRAVENVFHALLDLQEQMVDMNPELSSQLGSPKPGKEGRPSGSDDDEIPSDTEDEADEGRGEDDETSEEEVEEAPRKKRRIGDAIKSVASFHEKFVPFRNGTIEKWFERTRLAAGKIGKGFTAFEQSPMKQIEHILADQHRLILRTQTKRSSYKVLGETEDDKDNKEENAENKAVDEEIFDDDDFYHHLLREVIERKTANIDNPVALSRQWLEIQKLRSKVKRKIDTKASKGRRMRYEPIPKLANFMAPVDTTTYSEDARTELFNSLFGQKSYVVGL
uniref:Putative apoptosis antagonizing transcription factor n=1 Tax=Ornithodoros turicata TaxID=34597 RepID=A0A2R5LEH8_9ACAR